MKTFLRKMKLSFLAMLCGWIACNIAWWLPEFWQDERVYPVAIYEIAIEGIISSMVILAAWLLIFLPLDTIIPAASSLRRPATAALCGCLAPLVVMALIFVCNAQEPIAAQGLRAGIRMHLDMGAQRVVLATCATGTVAAWSRALMDQFNGRQT